MCDEGIVFAEALCGAVVSCGRTKAMKKRLWCVGGKEINEKQRDEKKLVTVGQRREMSKSHLGDCVGVSTCAQNTRSLTHSSECSQSCQCSHTPDQPNANLFVKLAQCPLITSLHSVFTCHLLADGHQRRAGMLVQLDASLGQRRLALINVVQFTFGLVELSTI